MTRYVSFIPQCIRRFSSSKIQNISTSGGIYSRSFSIPKPLPDPAMLNIVSQEDKRDFEASYSFILSQVVNEKLITPIKKVNDELEKIMNYNVPTGRKLRPYIMIATYKFFSKDNDLTAENLRKMHILAWFIEIFNAAYVMQDDLTDNSKTRRGKPTWFECVGAKSQNDSLLLNTVGVQLLKKYFSSHRNYLRILDIYFEMLKITEVGLALESITSLDEFTEERYYDIAKGKMGFYLLNFTTTLGTLLAGREDLMISDTAGKFFDVLSILYTIQNDYMDCYGEMMTGKQSGDIEEGQCTWLILSALKQATASQKNILLKCYGSHNKNDVDNVKRIYEELGIRNQYDAIVAEYYQRASFESGNICNNDLREFCEMLTKIFFRMN